MCKIKKPRDILFLNSLTKKICDHLTVEKNSQLSSPKTKNARNPTPMQFKKPRSLI